MTTLRNFPLDDEIPSGGSQPLTLTFPTDANLGDVSAAVIAGVATPSGDGFNWVGSATLNSSPYAVSVLGGLATDGALTDGLVVATEAFEGVTVLANVEGGSVGYLIVPNGLRVYANGFNVTGDSFNSGALEVGGALTADVGVIFPTSDPGGGAAWNDGGVVKVGP